MDNSAQSSNTSSPSESQTVPAETPPTQPSDPVMPPVTPQSAEPQPTTPAPMDPPATPAPTQPATPEPITTQPPADPPMQQTPPADPPAPVPVAPMPESNPTPVPTTPAAETPVTPTPAEPAPTVTPEPTPAATPSDPKAGDTNASSSLASNQTPPPPQQPQAKHGRISPWTIILILVLLGFCGFFAYIALNSKGKPVPIAQITPTPIPTPVAQSILTLEPAPVGTQAAKPGVQTYDVKINSGTNTVNAVQLDLAYDPSVLTNVTIIPGTFFTNPSQLVNDLDTKNGRISYALGIQPKDKGIKGAGVVAEIMFQFQPTATVSSTTIKFLPKTLVAGQGVNPSVLKSATDATIVVPHPQGTTTQLQPTTAPAAQ
jgi:hypothetical protein